MMPKKMAMTGMPRVFETALGQHIDGHGAVEQGVRCPVDLTHAPRAQRRLYLVRPETGAR